MTIEDKEPVFGWKEMTLGYGYGMIFGVIMGYIVISSQWLVRIFYGKPKKRTKMTRNEAHVN